MTDEQPMGNVIEQLIRMQRSAIASAGEMLRSPFSSDGHGDTPTLSLGDASSQTGPLLDAFDMYFDFARYIFRAAAESVVPARATKRNEGVPTIVIPEAPGTASADEPLWLHNPTDDAYRDLNLRCGPLETGAGVRLDPECVTLNPSHVDYLEPHSDFPVELQASVGDVPPGLYRGVIQVNGVDELWSNVHVVVGDSPSTTT